MWNNYIEKSGENMSKIKFLYVAIIFVVASSLFYVQDAQAYRAVKTISKVTAKADLPYWSDLKGCGKFKAQSQTTRKGFKKLHHDVSFYTVGGSVSAPGTGATGSASSKSYSKSTKGKIYTTSGNVCAGGLAIYLGMYTTTEVDQNSSRTYTATAKI